MKRNDTVAEGIETAEQLRRLRVEGCSEAQGFLFAAAKPPDEATQHCFRGRASALRLVSA